MKLKPSERLTLLTLAALILAALGAVAYLAFKPRPTLNVLAAAPSAAAQSQGYEGHPTLGDAAAPVKIILFENFLCEHCKAFETSVFEQLERVYFSTGKAEAYYVNLAWGEADVVRAGRAGECTFKQNSAAFWDYKKALFAAQGAVGWATLGTLEQLAAAVPGLGAAELRTCVETGATQSEVARDLALADFIGVTGTPSVVIGDQGFEAPSFATLEAAIDTQLAQLE